MTNDKKIPPVQGIRIGQRPRRKSNRSMPTMIYFAHHKQEARVKIGVSAHLAQRLSQLVRENGPLELISTFPGTRAHEKLLHARFAAIRVKAFGPEREWYRASPEILSYAMSAPLGMRMEIGLDRRELASIRTSINIPTKIWDELRVAAIRRNLTAGAAVEEAILLWIAQVGQTQEVGK